jgi:hypothetical protein
MATLLLVSSTSFMVGMHVCMGEVQSIAIFSKADGCPMEKNLPPCHRQMTAPCCDDETVIHEADDFKLTAAHQQVSPLATDVLPSLVLISEIIPSMPSSYPEYVNYDPPIRSCDLIVEHQVFLI